VSCGVAVCRHVYHDVALQCLTVSHHECLASLSCSVAVSCSVSCSLAVCRHVCHVVLQCFTVSHHGCLAVCRVVLLCLTVSHHVSLDGGVMIVSSESRCCLAVFCSV